MLIFFYLLSTGNTNEFKFWRLLTRDENSIGNKNTKTISCSETYNICHGRMPVHQPWHVQSLTCRRMTESKPYHPIHFFPTGMRQWWVSLTLTETKCPAWGRCLSATEAEIPHWEVCSLLRAKLSGEPDKLHGNVPTLQGSTIRVKA